MVDDKEEAYPGMAKKIVILKQHDEDYQLEEIGEELREEIYIIDEEEDPTIDNVWGEPDIEWDEVGFMKDPTFKDIEDESTLVCDM